MAEIVRLSHSSLEDVRTCSMKYKLRKVDAVSERPGWALIGGNAVHHVTEHIDKQDFGIQVDEEDLDFNAAMDSEIAKQQERSPEFATSEYYCSGRKSKEWPDKENEKWWRHHGPYMVERWRMFKRISPWQIWITPQGEPAVELALQAEYGGIPVKGYLDIVMEDPKTGDLIVLDKKTGANEPKSNNQLGQYGDMVAKLVGEQYRPKWGTYWMARTGGLTAPVDIRPLAKDLDEDYRKAKTIIELDLFLTSPSNLCGSCSVNRSCPFYSPGVTLGSER